MKNLASHWAAGVATLAMLVVNMPAVEAGAAARAVVWRLAGDPVPPPVQPDSADGAVRVFVHNGDGSALASIQRIVTPFVVVADASDAELVWDAQTKEALVAGDVIAHAIEAIDVPAVVDRVRAVDELKELSKRAPQTFELLPDNRLHHNNEYVTFKASGVQDKYLVIFNIAGDGTVQFLFPRKATDKPQIDTDDWLLGDITVREPFGSDTIIAIASDQRLEALEAALRRLDNTRNAGRVPKLVGDLLPEPPAARLGFSSLFTGE